ncbi:AI-2E family transporter [Rhodobacteraceae bacterium NNCM2]|nr:AI-2E family transporter [Coraliihabitans acroporae]
MTRRAVILLQATSSEAHELRQQVQTVSLAVIAILAVTTALHWAADLLIPIALAALLSLVLSPISAAFERVGLPRPAAALTTVVGSLAALMTLLYALLPSTASWRYRVPGIARDVERVLRDLSQNVSDSTGIEAPEDGPEKLANTGQALVTDLALGTPIAMAGVLVCTFLTYFMIAERERVWRGMVCLARSTGARLQVGRAIRLIQRDVAQYLFAITCINIGLGVVAGHAFWLIGLPDPWVWGAAMTLMNFIPYLGPLVMNLIVLTVGLVSFEYPEQALIAPVVLGLLNLIEGNMITPSIVGRQMRVTPLAVFLAVTFGVWIWGAAGALIATPALIVVKSALQRREDA